MKTQNSGLLILDAWHWYFEIRLGKLRIGIGEADMEVGVEFKEEMGMGKGGLGRKMRKWKRGEK